MNEFGLYSKPGAFYSVHCSSATCDGSEEDVGCLSARVGSCDVPVRGGGSTAVRHEDRDRVIDGYVLGAAGPEHRQVLGDGHHERAERVVLGAARRPPVALPQRKTYRRETIDRKDDQHPDRRVAAVPTTNEHC